MKKSFDIKIIPKIKEDRFKEKKKKLKAKKEPNFFGEGKSKKVGITPRIGYSLKKAMGIRR